MKNSVIIVAKAALRAKVGWRTKARLLRYILIDILCSPIRATLLRLDNLLFSGYRATTIEAPYFIISQPRSGTTFLHRTLAADKDNFFSITYMEWRWPYITVWWLIDHLRLRNWINNWCYWPSTKYGRLANKMHPHIYGDYEEHGIFLEEKFYMHYFVFRRFPFPEVLEAVNYDHPDEMLDALLTVVKKVKFYRNCKGHWLTKENECNLFYQALLQRCQDAKLIFMDRNYDEMMKSYNELSAVSTMAKINFDPSHIYGWAAANLKFRKKEYLLYRTFKECHNSNRAVMLKYEDFTTNIRSEIHRVYDQLGLVMSDEYSHTLEQIEEEQATRKRGY